MELETKRKGGDTILTIKVPAKEVGKVFDEIKEDALKGVSVPGFRKGKAPKPIAEKQLSEDRLAELLFNRIIPEAYGDALRKEGIKPIVPPLVKIISFKKGEELVFEARTAEMPKTALGNYKSALKGLKGKVIYGPDGKPLKGGDHITAEQVLAKLRETADVVIPSVLVDQEVQRMLTNLLRQTQTLGIEIDQYLAAEGRTIEQLRKQYREAAEKTIKDEFIINEVIRSEDIKADRKEIEEMIAAAPDETSKKELEKDAGRQYIETILRKRKAIEHLLRLAEGDN